MTGCGRKIGPFDCCTVVVGDCLDVMAEMPDGCVNLVVTDPPYTREMLYVYQYLADACPRVMRRGASLVTLIGHYALPEIVQVFSGKLKYRWLFCMNQFEGAHARMAMGIEVMWKPILWYVKEAYPQGRGFIRDGFVVTGTGGQQKKLYHWEQDLSWATFLIEKLSSKADLVFDPFMGSGTAAVEAQRLGRHFFGCDISEECVAMTEKRLSTVQLAMEI